jgi:hypothetical protein
VTPTTPDPRADFGSRLRRQRESRSLTIHDVSKTTKIPERSVSLLENGAFDDLPGDVFVRGFLKSYCRAVGLETDPTLREYDELRGKGPRPKREPSLVRPGVSRSAEVEAVPAAPPARQAPVDQVASTAKPPPTESMPAPQDKAEGGEPPVTPETAVDAELSLFGALRSARVGTSRISLTLAVIILVIVATLTLSLLLQGPGRVGDGVSFRPYRDELR